MTPAAEAAGAPNPLPRQASALAACVALATFAVRTWGIDQHFWMLGDQIRDWTIALGPFRDLPLVGPATHVGGYTVGPAFYWVLWAVRVTWGPWFDNLPHGGGIGQAALQSAVDALLLVAIWRRFGSPWLALASVVLVATGPLDLSLAAIVWNPVVGSTLAKAAIALVLLDWHRRGAWRLAIVVATAWAAVHAYTGAVFVAAGILLLVLLGPLLRGERQQWLRQAAVVLSVVAVLQVPYLAHQVRTGFRAPAMGAVSGSVANVLSGARPPEITKSVNGYLAAVHDIQVSPFALPHLGWVLLACGGIVAIRWRRDPAVLALTVVPPLLALAGYALFLAELDGYYYLSLMPSTVLIVVLAATAVPARQVVHAVAVVLVVGSLVAVPARVRQAGTMHRMPEYGALVAGSNVVASRKQPLRRISTEFALPPTADPEFPYRILGGVIDRSSAWTAVIRGDGSVRYQREGPR
jgi:hypothetical protein